MPTYEYQCLDCNHEFEKVQSMKDDPLTICPECKGKIKRKIGMGIGLCIKTNWEYVRVPIKKGSKNVYHSSQEINKARKEGKFHDPKTGRNYTKKD